MRVNKLNMEVVRDELERLKRDTKASPAKGGKIPYFKWEVGDNVVRILPPYSAKGLVFKKRIQHFNLPPEGDIAFCLRTWDSFDSCFICDKIAELHSQFPGVIDTGRQDAVDSYLCNLIDRANEAAGPQIGSFSARQYNWVMQQLNDRRIGDITDVDEGFDIKVTKTVTRKRNRDTTRYVETLMPRPCTLHDNPEIAEAWVSKIWDLDKVVKEPDDEWLLGIKASANALYKSFSSRQTRSETAEVRKAVDAGTRVRDKKEEPKKEVEKESTAPADYPSCFGTDCDLSESACNAECSLFDECKVICGLVEKEKPKRQPMKAKPKTATSISVATSRAAVVPESTKPNFASYPACFAGKDVPEPHDDAGTQFGPQSDLEKCTFCEHEIRCQTEAKKKGLL